MRTRILAVISIIIIAAFVLYKWYAANNIQTMHPIQQTAVLSVYATGTVEPTFEATISATIPGLLERIEKYEGDQVSPGDVLAKLNTSVEEAKLSEYLSQKDYLESEVTRNRALAQKAFMSKSELEKAISTRDQNLAQIKTQQELIDRMQIKSPIKGTVVRRDIDAGEYVSSGQALFSVGQTETLRINADIDEEEIPLIQKGQKAYIKSDAFDNVVEGVVTEITPKGDPVNKNFRIRISLPKDTDFLIGMTVDVNVIIREEQNALMIPSTAVINDFVYIRQGVRNLKRKVKLGIEGEDTVQVLSGLSEQDRVIVNPRRDLPSHD